MELASGSFRIFKEVLSILIFYSLSFPPESEIAEKFSLLFAVPIKGNGLTYAPSLRLQLIAGLIALRIFGA